MMLAVRPVKPDSEVRPALVFVPSLGWQPGAALLRQLAGGYALQLAATADPSAVLQQLVHLGRPCHLIGHDLGTVPALRAAVACPRQVRSLTLINPAAFGLLRQLHDREGWDAANRLLSEVRALHCAGDCTPAARLVIRFWFGRTTWWLLGPGQKRNILRQLPAMVDILASLYDDEPHRQDLRELPMPVHLVCSRRAPMPSRRLARRMCSLIPAATLSPGNRAGDSRALHIGNCISDWLQRQDSAGGPDRSARERNTAWNDAT